MIRWTPDEVTALAERLAPLVEGGTYLDRRTGWRGALRKPIRPDLTVKAPDGRPKVGLVGASSKEDRDQEMRLAFLDDVEAVEGEPTGFGG